ncbi:MAG: glycosyl hydrolase [Ruminiclostridium sp.]
MKKRTFLRNAVAVLLAAASVASCGNTAPATEATTADTTISTEETAPAQDNGTDETAASGEIDMEAALAYKTDFDALLKSLDEKTVAEDDTVSDNTNPETLALFRWFKENYGKNVIAGQQIFGAKNNEDVLYYYLTGDLPAIKGFDFIFKTTPGGDSDDWTQLAIDWHTKSNGIVAFCWHWNVPVDVDDESNNAEAFYSEDIKNFSLKNAVTPGTKEYEIVIYDIELIARELKRLEEAGVPVLWRPLHEASGKWFWWGMADKETVENQYYQKLWYMLYDRLENYHKLSNLIWVWNGQNKHTMVHPNTYDISGIDIYPDSEDHSAQIKSNENLAKITESGKMLTISECGYIPDSDELKNAAGTNNWLYFMPWNGDFVYKGSTVLGIPRINTEKMSEEFLKKVYAADNIITWSKLPDFEGTERELPDRLKYMLPDIEKQKEKDAAN